MSKSPKTAYSKAEIEEIFHRFSLQRPDPRSDLQYNTPFTLLVAVVLSAQATDASVNKATTPLFAAADTPQKMLELGEERLGHYIRSIGLWRNKAKNVIALSKLLIEKYHSEVPDTLEALLSLPGVGRKTANVVLNVAFHRPTLAVDTHIFRVANRLELAPGNTPDEVEKNLLSIVPKARLNHAHQWLILHGRYVCKARNPDCAHCIIADLCKAAVKTGAIPAPIVELHQTEAP
ncbi:MAG: Endonuclease III [Candidatus Tokpelaia hoelldobleri]|uniref:Endonuclease III n=1 Tax=Candidatus Tokpelaia hoelldobleri TaxID=1902579 RepID=A0A1U9JSF9_9HYPH|nr:MAG: Endonuclease III [Candidatus Tokpelaia hoelldoblerii]